ncbi:MAG: hypothetical protein LBR92_03150 [Puniceicoccales bacterium]|jgi:hypothetical protein|nr:hypothetical protein [Puniceicoccales bacterium]
MRVHILLSEIVVGFFLIIISSWGSGAIPIFPLRKMGQRLPWGHISTLNEMQEQSKSKGIFAHTLDHIEEFYGITVDEFRQLPLAFRRRIVNFKKSCNLHTMREINKFLHEFLRTMPFYRHYVVERTFFKAICFIIQSSDIQHNSKICELLEAIEREFREVEEFICPLPRYPLFSEVMPWHDDPLGGAIEKGDPDAFKEDLTRCLAADSIHNVSSGDTAGLFAIYQRVAENEGVWDDEIADLFQELAKKYPPKNRSY